VLSYRHGFHAGNHADVLKHVVEILLLDYLQKKDKPLLYIDTHAGAGQYPLDSGFSAKNHEHRSGISRLRSAAEHTPLPAQLARYLEVIDTYYQDSGDANNYPGSPLIAQQLLRKNDRAELFELHPADYEELQHVTAGRARVHQEDGFSGLKALLPPPSRRALVLIDPPYENKRDYQTLIHSLNDALKRFPSGVYALWYPLLPRQESLGLEKKLISCVADNYLSARLEVYAPQGEHGMFGSGMFVANPPWTLRTELEKCLPALAEHLGQNGQGTFSLSGKQR